MKRTMITLQINKTPETLARQCHNTETEDDDAKSEECPTGACVCPFDDTPCSEVTPEQWKNLLKEEEIPFRKGELVAVRDNHSKEWAIKVFAGYSTDTHDFKYRVYNRLDNLDDSKCTNYQRCEKLSVFSNKFFFG